ncbi:hypothetical protein EVAR_31563_1 [Eumeta japonica]|uniref:Uncharacterized protein n=1 Tax=Eumeta variegata TaxID=151549 RepID=A0A4C1V9W7_EUMVA|nr:hypothetical protein EVAR_31563_1 [Eumeta japonica]
MQPIGDRPAIVPSVSAEGRQLQGRDNIANELTSSIVSEKVGGGRKVWRSERLKNPPVWLIYQSRVRSGGGLSPRAETRSARLTNLLHHNRFYPPSDRPF